MKCVLFPLPLFVRQNENVELLDVSGMPGMLLLADINVPESGTAKAAL